MPDPCQEIRDAIGDLQAAIDADRELLSKPPYPTGTERGDIQRDITKKTDEIKQKQADLVQCLNQNNIVEPGVFQCDDGGLYYVREIGVHIPPPDVAAAVGTNVYWVGEDQRGSFCNVFIGQRSGAEISGAWFDVPKGAAHSSGEIRLSVDPSDNSRTRFSATGGFGGSRWTAYRPYNFRPPGLRAPADFRKAGFSPAGEGDLTGTWVANDGGTYYVRQIDNQVVWFGESKSFSNVFSGTRSGNTITGTWADVPKAGILQSGSLTLNIISDH